MLNKIKLVGKILPIEAKEKPEEIEKEKSEYELIYFSLLVPNPSGSLTILRCVAQGEVAEKIKKEIRELAEPEVWKIKGYLRNEKTGRQVIIKVIEFTKLDTDVESIDNNLSNQAQLLGKIVTDLEIRENDGKAEVLSFRLVVPREGNISPSFFCRVQGKLIEEAKNKLKKGDIVLLEGFLQTKKLVDEERGEEEGKRFSRISSVICQAFTLLGNDSVSSFDSVDKLTRIVGEVEKIDFTKPKKSGGWQEKITE